MTEAGPGTGPLLSIEGVSKAFGATQALRDVSLSVDAGEVHALIGENGAGKSTLMKVLSGALRADEGRILLRGRPRRFASPAEGRASGVAMIYQELTLAPHLTVEANMTLGVERSRLGFIRAERERCREALARLGHEDLPLDAPVASLGVGQQQIVEIARALMTDAAVVIMDEPTSSLSASDTEALFAAIRRLKDAGMAVIYISHFLEEVTRVADTYTVLRDGERAAAGRMSETTIAELIEKMVGRTLNEMFPRVDHTPGETLIEVEGLAGAPLPRGVTLRVRRSEIFGVAGLVGSGRSETARRVFGLERATGGTLRVAGHPGRRAEWIDPQWALRMGIALLSENRKEEGLATSLSLAANTTLPVLGRFAAWGGWGPLSLGREREAVKRRAQGMNIRCESIDQPADRLSGGNQQKVALARILETDSDILLLDEPTRGVDVGSKVEIYRLIGDLAARGKAVVFISSYLPELLGVCDTIAVMRRGRMGRARPAAEWTEQDIMREATSGDAPAD